MGHISIALFCYKPLNNDAQYTLMGRKQNFQAAESYSTTVYIEIAIWRHLTLTGFFAVLDGLLHQPISFIDKLWPLSLQTEIKILTVLLQAWFTMNGVWYSQIDEFFVLSFAFLQDVIFIENFLQCHILTPANTLSVSCMLYTTIKYWQKLVNSDLDDV